MIKIKKKWLNACFKIIKVIHQEIMLIKFIVLMVMHQSYPTNIVFLKVVFNKVMLEVVWEVQVIIFSKIKTLLIKNILLIINYLHKVHLQNLILIIHNYPV